MSVGLTMDEWRTLQFAPLWVLSSLVGHYRGFDPLEVDALSRSLDIADEAPRGLAGDVLAVMRTDLDALVVAYEDDRRTSGSGLADVVEVLARVTPADAAEFREMLRRLGVRIATARGPFGQTASVEDLQHVQMVTQLLSAPPRSTAVGSAAV